MAINARDGYVDIMKDAVENFHGNQLVYVDWDKHRMFSAAAAFPLPPEMPFGALMQEVIPSIWNGHPDFAELNWATVEWILDDKPFIPNPESSLADNGIGHKSLLRFITPGLDGIAGTGS